VLDTMLSIVDVDDVSRGHILAAERGVPGRRYLLNGATLSVREAITQLARASGERIRPLVLPPGVAGVAGRFAPLAGAGTNGRTLCAEIVRTLAHGHRFDGRRAVRELGLTYTPLIATMRRTIEWYREQGLLEG
jgi:dihydroflavonol-4-reductase